MPCRKNGSKGMGEIMKSISFFNYLIISLVFLVFGCHTNHHDNSKTKYINMEKNNSSIVPIKENLDTSNYIHWKLATNENVFVKKVWSDSKEQNCKGCHQGYDLRDIIGKKHKKSHWDIKLKHASNKIMNCQTCHNKDAVWKFNFGQKNVTANYSMKLCSGCHFKQRKDWELGAHGKRENGWRYKRAIYNCVSCHNPHSPTFKMRWPKVAPYRPINNEGRL
jgi:hypothetical protein